MYKILFLAMNTILLQIDTVFKKNILNNFYNRLNSLRILPSTCYIFMNQHEIVHSYLSHFV